MTGVHIAHDCKIGNENIFVNQVTLGGHVNIMNNVVVGGFICNNSICNYWILLNDWWNEWN